MALDDLELHALDLVMEEAVERHPEGYEGPGDKADRWRFKAEGGVVVVGMNLMLFYRLLSFFVAGNLHTTRRLANSLLGTGDYCLRHPLSSIWRQGTACSVIGSIEKWSLFPSCLGKDSQSWTMNG